MDLPEELVDKMKALKDEFPEVFEKTDYVEVKWNMADDIIIFKIVEDGTSFTIIK